MYISHASNFEVTIHMPIEVEILSWPFSGEKKLYFNVYFITTLLSMVY